MEENRSLSNPVVLLAIVLLICASTSIGLAQRSVRVSRTRTNQEKRNPPKALQSRTSFWQIWSTQGFTDNKKSESFNLFPGAVPPHVPIGQLIMIDDVWEDVLLQSGKGFISRLMFGLTLYSTENIIFPPNRKVQALKTLVLNPYFCII